MWRNKIEPGKVETDNFNQWKVPPQLGFFFMASVYTHMDYIYIERERQHIHILRRNLTWQCKTHHLHDCMEPFHPIFHNSNQSRPFPVFLVYQNKSLQGPGSQHFNAAQLLRCGPQPHHAGPAVPQLDDRGFFGQNGFDFCGTWGVLFLPSALGPTMSQESALKLGHQLDGLVVELPIL